MSTHTCTHLRRPHMISMQLLEKDTMETKYKHVAITSMYTDENKLENFYMCKHICSMRMIFL